MFAWAYTVQRANAFKLEMRLQFTISNSYNILTSREGYNTVPKRHRYKGVKKHMKEKEREKLKAAKVYG